MPRPGIQGHGFQGICQRGIQADQVLSPSSVHGKGAVLPVGLDAPQQNDPVGTRAGLHLGFQRSEAVVQLNAVVAVAGGHVQLIDIVFTDTGGILQLVVAAAQVRQNLIGALGGDQDGIVPRACLDTDHAALATLSIQLRIRIGGHDAVGFSGGGAVQIQISIGVDGTAQHDQARQHQGDAADVHVPGQGGFSLTVRADGFFVDAAIGVLFVGILCQDVQYQLARIQGIVGNTLGSSLCPGIGLGDVQPALIFPCPHRHGQGGGVCGKGLKSLVDGFLNGVLRLRDHGAAVGAVGFVLSQFACLARGVLRYILLGKLTAALRKDSLYPLRLLIQVFILVGFGNGNGGFVIFKLLRGAKGVFLALVDLCQGGFTLGRSPLYGFCRGRLGTFSCPRFPALGSSSGWCGNHRCFRCVPLGAAGGDWGSPSAIFHALGGNAGRLRPLSQGRYRYQRAEQQHTQQCCRERRKWASSFLGTLFHVYPPVTLAAP